MTDPIGRFLLDTADHPRRWRALSPLLRGVAPLLRDEPPRDPIFIVASPRSGTTMLFELLQSSPETVAMRRESHALWSTFRDPSQPDAVIEPERAGRSERRLLRFVVRRMAGGRRYLDKAPANSLRVPYLDALFPTARFVFLRRDGRAVISSLMTGWRSEGGLFRGRDVGMPLRIDGYDGSRWKFVQPPGWTDMAAGHSLAEVCAFQWRACTEAILDAARLIPAERWVDVRYEDLIARPREETERLLRELRLQPDPAVLSWASDLGIHVSKAVTPPDPDKWRREHGVEIGRILPSIEPLQSRLGYGP
jgi:hypothetical protein